MADQPDLPSRPSNGGDPLPAEAAIERALEQVRHALSSIRFGQVILTVHDGVVVQLDRIEKTRLR